MRALHAATVGPAASPQWRRVAPQTAPSPPALVPDLCRLRAIAGDRRSGAEIERWVLRPARRAQLLGEQRHRDSAVLVAHQSERDVLVEAVLDQVFGRRREEAARRAGGGAVDLGGGVHVATGEEDAGGVRDGHFPTSGFAHHRGWTSEMAKCLREEQRAPAKLTAALVLVVLVRHHDGPAERTRGAHLVGELLARRPHKRRQRQVEQQVRDGRATVGVSRRARGRLILLE
eukprot:3688774-Prymnesium_polylepis.1